MLRRHLSSGSTALVGLGGCRQGLIKSRCREAAGFRVVLDVRVFGRLVNEERAVQFDVVDWAGHGLPLSWVMDRILGASPGALEEVGRGEGGGVMCFRRGRNDPRPEVQRAGSGGDVDGGGARGEVGSLSRSQSPIKTYPAQK